MPDQLPADPRHLWAKTSQQGNGLWHSLPAHTVETAAVCLALWRHATSTHARRRFADAIGVADDDLAGRVAAWWCGLHDLGKATPDFQALDEQGRRRAEAGGFRFRTGVATKAGRLRHGLMSACTLPAATADIVAADPRTLRRLALAVAGHHGVMATAADLQEVRRRLAITEGPEWAAARRELAVRLAADLDLPPGLSLTLPSPASALWLAGLASVADWIASSESHFPYTGDHPPDWPAFDDRVAQARRVLGEIGWLARPEWSPRRAFTDAFPFAPNPLQLAAAAAAEAAEGPFLLVVEAPMGWGKTEAALWAAEAAIPAHGLDGLYVAMPTQATSDQLFQRVCAYLQNGPARDRVAGVQLLHGHAALSSTIETLARSSFLELAPSAIDRDGEPVGGGVAAAEWFSGRKRGLLAPIGVGTVDQALLAILQTRHHFVRLHGLSGKVLVLDEVHAYDTYMSTLIDRLLEWMGAMGAPVILLSATLPQDRRAELAAAYARGAGHPPPALDGAPPYPRLTLVDGQRGRVVSVPTEDAGQEIRLRWWRDASPDWMAIADALAVRLVDGGCAVVICTTVREAQEAFTVIAGAFAGDEADLFHARFRHRERARVQERTLRNFGKPGIGERPHRRVLVATQVVEQSLDLDFDILVTRFAPVDLLFQRIGRLHRHQRDGRPPALADPECWIVGPGTGADPRPVFDRASTAVYDEHVLLRSWIALRDRDMLRAPADIPVLLERVYGPAAADDRAEPGFAETFHAFATERDRHESLARRNAIADPTATAQAEPLLATSLDLDAADGEGSTQAQALTRLGAPRVTAIVLTRAEAELAPHGPVFSRSDLRWLLERSAPLSGWRVVTDVLALPTPAGWERTSLLRGHRLILLDDDKRARFGHTSLHLDDRRGIVLGDADD